MFKFAVGAFFALCSFVSLARVQIVVEAESLSDHGGWSLDTQHMEIMGSSYLLAHGLGRPVKDAVGVFDSPAEGEFSLWVRTRNWTRPWSEAAAGRFKVAVNNVTLEQVFGIGSGEWNWVKCASKVKLAKGRNELRIKDLTGFDARVDAIAFTSDDSEPVVSSQSVANARQYDLVVCGGGVAGVCAALAAARNSLKVALLQDRDVLGGNNSSEVRVWLGGHQQCGKYPRLGDIVAEIGPAGGGNSRAAAFYEDDKKLAVVKAEKNIDLYLGTKALGVEKDGDGRIAAVIGVNTRTLARTRFAAPLFVDATGDGTVGYMAGADFNMGREAKSETAEEFAPERADNLTMGASCQWRAVETSAPQTFPAEPWMIEFNESNATRKLRGDWDWETGFGRDQIVEAERIRDYGMLIAYSNWSFVKNFSRSRDQFATKRLDWVAFVAGKRESRRLLGDVVLTETDVQNYRRYPDGTCLASWSIDLHYPQTEEMSNFKGESFRSYCEQRWIFLYPIPYRCFYSRNVPNLFMAGRNISVTHNALGSVRVMRTTGMMGEVVGMAAAVCRRRGCSPREVYKTHFADLERLMAKGAGAGLPQTEQAYNVHPTLGLDPDDPAEIERNRKLKWSMADLFRDYPVLEKWSYPRLEWQHALGGMKPVGEAVEFRSSKGEIVTVRRDSAGMAAVKGEGYECRGGDGKWVKCDVFTGENGVAPHLAKPPAKEYSAVSEFGLFSGGGETYGHIYCIADKCPELRVGESREETLNDNSAHFEQCVKMISAGKPRVWKSESALAFRMYRLSGDIEDTWIIATEPKRRPFAREFSIAPAEGKKLTEKDSVRRRIWYSAADTVRLLSFQYFRDSNRRQKLVRAQDLVIAILADSSSYFQPEVAAFTLDALSCGLDGDEAAWWIVANSLYRRQYGELDYIRNRWPEIRAIAGKVESDARNTTHARILRYGALLAAADMAKAIGEKRDYVKFFASASSARIAAMESYIPGADAVADIYALVFNLAEGFNSGTAVRSLVKKPWTSDGDLFVETLGCIALAANGRKAEALNRVDEIWGGMVKRGFDVTFERYSVNVSGKAAYASNDRPFGLDLCHIRGSGAAYLLPELLKAGSSNPFSVDAYPRRMAFKPEQWTGGDRSWQMKRHQSKLQEVKAGGAKVVFIGDSITHFWESKGKEQFKKYFSQGEYKMLNLGTSADRTEHVLWRLTDGGELDGYEAKVVVIMIGTNNSGHYSEADEPPVDTILGIREILRTVRQKQPQAKIVLHPIFLRGVSYSPTRLRNNVVNAEIRHFVDDKNIFWCDFSEAFIAENGDVRKDLMPDYLHPEAAGYEIWAEAVMPYVKAALASEPMPPSRYSPLDAGMPSRSAVNPATKIKYFIAKDKTGNTLGTNGWLDHIQKNRERILGGESEIDYVFAGDSLMHLWESRGKDFLAELKSSRSVLHLGFSGDRTEELLWRLKYGELNNYRAKNIALLIGTNNPVADGADGIVSGVKACLEAVAAKQPQARIFLHAIFPRRDGPQGIDGPMATRPIHDAANEQIRKLADGKKVVLVDFASCFLDENNDTKWIMPDRLHPSPDGFRIWYNELKKRFGDSKEKCNE